jgi:F1F0 ATPase subunit 2
MVTGNAFPLTAGQAAMLFLALLAGIVLGFVYFGGLWYTVQRINQAKHQALLFIGSFLLRTLVVLVGFYLVADGRIERIAVSLLGFLVARQYIIKRAQPPAQKEQGHGI